MGTDTLPGVEMFIAHEQTEKRRHKEIMDSVAETKEKQSEIFNALAVLRGEMISARAFERPKPVPAPLDWEQVNVNELYRMLENPEKET